MSIEYPRVSPRGAEAPLSFSSPFPREGGLRGMGLSAKNYLTILERFLYTIHAGLLVDREYYPRDCGV